MPSRISLRLGRHLFVTEKSDVSGRVVRGGMREYAPEHLRAREGSMDEETDGSVRQDLSEQSGHQEQVIVVNPDQITYTIR